jgi:glycosyltransferase involved in cell wall biosynthesis
VVSDEREKGEKLVLGEAVNLSILIPARNEQFLAQTIENILINIKGDTEVIAILDGAWADPQIPDDKRVTLVYHPESIGQRAATNEAARLARGKYIMKCDAHCSFNRGFDVELTQECEDDWTVVPRMYNLHAFNWVCQKCGHETYQGPKRCEECKSTDVVMDILWKRRKSRRTDFAKFDSVLRFGYWRAYEKRPEAQGDIADVMCCVGACWMMPKARYWELGGVDEGHGSWGQMGVEIACKSWLSGGRQVVNKRTWFAHMFRTQKGFGFPYPISRGDQDRAREYSRWLWQGGNWDKAIHPLSWLVDKFAPVPGWEQEPEQAQSAILYYTCNTHDPVIEDVCRRQLTTACNGHDLLTVSRRPIAFGDCNIVMDGERSAEMMHRQILAGLEQIEADYVFLCESDVLYHPSHFDFVPPTRDKFYYNTNVWKVRYTDGLAVWTDNLQQVSGICASRDLLLKFYRKRVAQIEAEGFNRHYEPGPKLGDWLTENWQSAQPNVDIRHDQTLTPSKWSIGDFRNKRYASGWRTADEVQGWGQTRGRMREFISDVFRGAD